MRGDGAGAPPLTRTSIVRSFLTFLTQKGVVRSGRSPSIVCRFSAVSGICLKKFSLMNPAALPAASCCHFWQGLNEWNMHWHYEKYSMTTKFNNSWLPFNNCQFDLSKFHWQKLRNPAHSLVHCHGRLSTLKHSLRSVRLTHLLPASLLCLLVLQVAQGVATWTIQAGTSTSIVMACGQRGLPLVSLMKPHSNWNYYLILNQWLADWGLHLDTLFPHVPLPDFNDDEQI